jgi:hypothetical protein
VQGQGELGISLEVVRVPGQMRMQMRMRMRMGYQEIAIGRRSEIADQASTYHPMGSMGDEYRTSVSCQVVLVLVLVLVLVSASYPLWVEAGIA